MIRAIKGRLGSSVQTKVAAVAIAAAMSALLVAYPTFILHHWASARDLLQEQRIIFTEVLAANAAATLVFQDQAAAAETLAAASRIPDVQAVWLYDDTGSRFSAWSADPTLAAPEIASRTTGAIFSSDRLTVTLPVVLDSEQVGTIVMVSSLDELKQVITGYIVAALLGLIGAVLLALLISTWLARRVLRPVRVLSRAMVNIQKSGNLDLHVTPVGDDELATLTRDFNGLLKRLRDHDEALQTAMADLVQARDQAEAANVAKSQFLANMSHEIRTPLNGVLGMAQVLEGVGLPPEHQGKVAVIRRSGELLLAVLNDILDISKIEAGKLELVEEDFVLTDTIATAFNSLADLAREKGLDCRLNLSPSVEGSWYGDSLRVHQVLSNLLANAIKFSEIGSVDVTVDRDAGGIVIAVADTGIGISKDVLPRLFNKFSQADSTTTRSFGGTGLGLAISRELVQLMGGDISVESEPGEGSCFTVRLPLRPASTPRSQAPAPVEKATVEDTGCRLRFLLAEDNPTNQMVARALLEPLGAELRIASDGVEALEFWRSERFDLVLLDIQMPRLDGIHVARAIRAGEEAGGCSRVPILALSANVMPHQIDAYLEAGMDGHVGKPIQVEKLYAAVDSALAAPSVSRVLSGQR